MFPRNPYAYGCVECGAEREDDDYTPTEHGALCPDCAAAEQRIADRDPEKVVRRYRRDRVSA